MGELLKMEHFMGVKEDNNEILGKFLYFSLSNLLVERSTLSEICKDMNLSIKPCARVCLTDAFKSATGDIYDRIVNKEYGELRISKVYCRDNRRIGDIYSRELVKETLGETTNRYKKLANIIFNKETGGLEYTIDRFDSDIDITGYCERALELYELYKICVGRNQIENFTENFLNSMDALKISVKGKLFFVPKNNMHMLSLFEDFIEALNRNNRRSGSLTINSMFVIDDKKQRDKMTTEFYNTVRKEIELYTEKIENLITSNSQSVAILERWILKVDELDVKKRHYEEILKRELSGFDEQYSNLKFLAGELSLRANKIKKEKCA